MFGTPDTKEEIAAKAKEAETEKAALKRYEDDDESDRRAAREFRPNVRVAKYKAGDFLCYDKAEVPLRFIENVQISYMGKSPHWYSGVYTQLACRAEQARIELVMTSGRSIHFAKFPRGCLLKNIMYLAP